MANRNKEMARLASVSCPERRSERGNRRIRVWRNFGDTEYVVPEYLVGKNRQRSLRRARARMGCANYDLNRHLALVGIHRQAFKTTPPITTGRRVYNV